MLLFPQNNCECVSTSHRSVCVHAAQTYSGSCQQSRHCVQRCSCVVCWGLQVYFGMIYVRHASSWERCRELGLVTGLLFCAATLGVHVGIPFNKSLNTVSYIAGHRGAGRGTAAGRAFDLLGLQALVRAAVQYYGVVLLLAERQLHHHLCGHGVPSAGHEPRHVADRGQTRSLLTKNVVGGAH